MHGQRLLTQVIKRTPVNFNQDDFVFSASRTSFEKTILFNAALAPRMDLFHAALAPRVDLSTSFEKTIPPCQDSLRTDVEGKQLNQKNGSPFCFVLFCFVLFHSFGILGRSNSDRLDAQSGQSYRESNVPHGAWDVKPLVQQGLRQQQKTFLERRGMMHSFKANLRVFTFYLALFQVIVTIAHDVPFQQDVLPLCPPQLQISAQTPDEILNDMDRSYGPTCDLNTAMCQYLNTPSKFPHIHFQNFHKKRLMKRGDHSV